MRSSARVLSWVLAAMIVVGAGETWEENAFAQVPAAQEKPDVQKLLYEGRLAAGEKELAAWIEAHPDDDTARFELGVIQFLRTSENLGASLFKFGLRGRRLVGGLAPLPLGDDVFPSNPHPQKISYDDARGIIETWIADLKKAEATLAEVKRSDVKLPLKVALIKVDLTGQGKPVSAAMLLRGMTGPQPPGVDPNQGQPDPFEEFVIAFDRGDVNWLRGYCHFLCAWGEMALACDAQELFERTAHLFFEKVDSPHAFLQEEQRDVAGVLGGRIEPIFDIIAWIHLLRFEIKEPERMGAALGHLEAMVANGQEMWKHYDAETDDDHEWIPNPKQTGVLGMPITEEMQKTWQDVLAETEQVLQGKKLVPFWRGTEKRGFNLRRVFTEPRTFDLLLWVQGTAATPYLEEGELTDFADPNMLGRINRTFGGLGFFGFAFWVN